MEKRILLSIKGSHRDYEGQGGTIELITEGKLSKKDDIYFIEYEESELSGMKGTTTLFSVQDKSVMMERYGTYTSHFFFEEGIKYIGSYETDFGLLQVEIYPTKVNHYITESEGMLDIEYQLNIGNRYASVNGLTLHFKNN